MAKLAFAFALTDRQVHGQTNFGRAGLAEGSSSPLQAFGLPVTPSAFPVAFSGYKIRTSYAAMVAKRSMGASGSVDGIDAAHGMIERARQKAKKARVDVMFTEGVVKKATCFATRAKPVAVKRNEC